LRVILIGLMVLGAVTLGLPAIASAGYSHYGQTQCFQSSTPFAYVTVPFGHVSVTFPVGQQGLRCYRTQHAPRYHYPTTPYPHYGYQYPVQQQPVFVPQPYPYQPQPYPYQPHPYYQSRHPLIQPGYPTHQTVQPHRPCRYQQMWDPYRFQMVWACR
jgi:hypothetical protein